MRRLTSDFAPVLLAAAKGELASPPALEWDARPAVKGVFAAQGYPDAPLTGTVIRGLAEASAAPEVVIFHAGTNLDADGTLRAAGGRVLNVTATGDTLKQAVDHAYAGARSIDWPGGFCRRDIAWRALSP
jgi:phosphoribosylamine--glycine ligase